MRVSVLAVVLAGCSFHPGSANNGPHDGAPGDVPIDHPMIMIDARPDSMIDAAIDARPDAMVDAILPPLDTDGDGIPDVTDNCPTIANANQRDHDADGHGDVCDKCPHLPSTLDPDTDGDGVGDACDPRPATAGDSRALWVGFYDAADISGWTTSGTWAVANGALTGGNTGQTLSYVQTPLTYQRAYAMTSVHVTALGATNMTTSPNVALSTGVINNQQDYSCFVQDSQQQGTRVNSLTFYPGTFTIQGAVWSGTFAAGSDLQLTDGVIAGAHHCTAAQGATSVPAPNGTAGATAGVVSLSTANATASFDYLFVVEVGN